MPATALPVLWRKAQALGGSNLRPQPASQAVAPQARGLPVRFRARFRARHQGRAPSRHRATDRTAAFLSLKIRPRSKCAARAVRKQTRMDRGLPVQAAAVLGRVGRLPEAAASARGYRAARASTRMSAFPMDAAPFAYWQRKLPARRKTLRRSAIPLDRDWLKRTGIQLRPPARSRPASPLARLAAPEPTSAPKRRFR